MLVLVEIPLSYWFILSASSLEINELLAPTLCNSICLILQMSKLELGSGE